MGDNGNLLPLRFLRAITTTTTIHLRLLTREPLDDGRWGVIGGKGHTFGFTTTTTTTTTTTITLRGADLLRWRRWRMIILILLGVRGREYKTWQRTEERNHGSE